MGRETNARALVKNSMPPLKEACATFKGFTVGEKRGEQIFQVLLSIIQRHRGPKPKRFYTMREVAAFFEIGHGTAQTVFSRLAREGALSLTRSSQTMIPARISRPRFAVRGVVCMPIWLPAFLLFFDWRQLFSELEEELSRHRFVLQPIFYQFNEETHPEFVDRILKFNPDYVLWNAPLSFCRMNMQSIIDAGVPILAIMGTDTPPLPGRIYRRNKERALKQGLKEWLTSGQIDRIVLPQGVSGDVTSSEGFGLILRESSLPYEVKTFHADYSVTHHLQHLAPDPRTGIIFADEMLFATLCSSVPDEMLRLFRRHRVIVSRQVALHSREKIPDDLSVDWLFFPSRRLARRIATDLSESKGALSSSKGVFVDEWRPHTPLTEIISSTLTV